MVPPSDPTEADAAGPSRFSLMTVIAVAFAVFMLIYIGITIDAGYDSLRVQAGDEVTYDYVARFANGTVWATTDQEVAEAAAEEGPYTLQPVASYRPRTTVIDRDDPSVFCGPEGDRAVQGALVGQTVTFQTSARHFAGAWEPFLPDRDGIPREITEHPFERLVFYQEAEEAAAEGNDHARNIDLDALNETLGTYEEGYVFNSGAVMPPGLDQRFENIDWNNRSLLVRYLVEDGDYIDVPGLPGGVTVRLTDNETRAVYRLDLERCGTFTVAPGSPLNNFGFPPGSYLVNGIDEDRIDLHYQEGQDLPPDETLTVTLTILSKERPDADATTE